jgi:hypothetical protein
LNKHAAAVALPPSHRIKARRPADNPGILLVPPAQQAVDGELAGVVAGPQGDAACTGQITVWITTPPRLAAEVVIVDLHGCLGVEFPERAKLPSNSFFSCPC